MYGVQFPAPVISLHMVMPRLDVYYPAVNGLKDPAVQRRINSTIQNEVNKVIDDQGYYKEPRTEVSGSYEIKTNERGILSLSIINDAYSGGAHGLRIIKSLTFDVETGRIYSFKDLFKENAGYVRVLSDMVAKQIRERNIFLLGEFKGIRLEPDFYIADKALVIYFQLYELTSYAFGFPYFPISIYDIRHIIDQNGPLEKLWY